MEINTGNHNSVLALGVQEKQSLHYQNIKYKPSTTNLASAESCGETQSYAFPTFKVSGLLAAEVCLPRSQQSALAERPASPVHWDLLPGSCSKCFLGVGRDTKCCTSRISISRVPALG